MTPQDGFPVVCTPQMEELIAEWGEEVDTPQPVKWMDDDDKAILQTAAVAPPPPTKRTRTASKKATPQREPKVEQKKRQQDFVPDPFRLTLMVFVPAALFLHIRLLLFYHGVHL